MTISVGIHPCIRDTDYISIFLICYLRYFLCFILLPTIRVPENDFEVSLGWDWRYPICFQSWFIVIQVMVGVPNFLTARCTSPHVYFYQFRLRMFSFITCVFKDFGQHLVRCPSKSHSISYPFHCFLQRDFKSRLKVLVQPTFPYIVV